MDFLEYTKLKLAISRQRLRVFLSTLQRVHQRQAIYVIDVASVWEATRESRCPNIFWEVVSEIQRRCFSFKVWICRNNDFINLRKSREE